MGSLIFLGYEGEAKQGLLDEIAHHNEMCAAGRDTDWAAILDLMNALDTPPFSAGMAGNYRCSGRVSFGHGAVMSGRFGERQVSRVTSHRRHHHS